MKPRVMAYPWVSVYRYLHAPLLLSQEFNLYLEQQNAPTRTVLRLVAG